MKRLLISLIICGLLILPTMAMIVQEPTIQNDMGGKEIKPIETILPEETILPNETILPILPNREIFIKKLVHYNEKTTVLTKTIMVVDKILGLKSVEETTPTTDIDVVLDDRIVAIIPTDSPFNGIETHEYCLEYQYGTTNWYNCEQELL